MLFIHKYVSYTIYTYLITYFFCALFWSVSVSFSRRVCRHGWYGWHGLRQEIEELDLSHIDAFAYVPCHRLGADAYEKNHHVGAHQV